MPREAALQCMNDLSMDPQRLYTVCLVIALGDASIYDDNLEVWEKDIKCLLLRLARIDPTHAAWTYRAYYMNMDPQEWSYLHLRLEDEEVAEVEERMKVGLDILDEFFASPDNVSFPPYSSFRIFADKLTAPFHRPTSCLSLGARSKLRPEHCSNLPSASVRCNGHGAWSSNIRHCVCCIADLPPFTKHSVRAARGK